MQPAICTARRPDSLLREMFGAEYFIQVLPERELATSLVDDQLSHPCRNGQRASGLLSGSGRGRIACRCRSSVR